jgi:alpha-beta hydrolase superfamily lysophospholipase
MQYITTKTEDGIEFTGMLFEAVKSKKLILHIHGMSGDMYTNSYYPVMHSYYPQNGWSFLIVEHRGTHSITQFNTDNGIRNIGNSYELFEDCVYDIKSWVKKAQELGYEEIWLQSHSLGPSKVTYYMNMVLDNPIKGLIWLSPSDMIGLVTVPDGKKDHEICIKEALELVNTNKGDQLLSHDLWGEMRLSANTYINFFGEKSNTAIFNYGNETLGWEKVQNIKVPVIAFTGTKDVGIVPVIDAYKSMTLLESNLVNSPRKKTVVYENAEHDFIGFGDKIVYEVINFIGQ